LDAASLVVADRPDVLGPQAEFGASDHRAGDLAARAQYLFRERDFTRVGRELRKEKERVGGVEADTDDVEGNIRRWPHFFTGMR
jgi:hypothetical protein